MTRRAHELLPIDRSTPRASLEGVPPLTEELRRELHIEERVAPVGDGAPDVRMLVYRPRNVPEPLPLLLSLHGGAFCFLGPDDFEGMDAAMARAHRCAVVAVDYRLAPEHPFPAAIDDCYAALCWAVDQPWARAPVVVTGGSAGGALSAGLCLLARDRGGPRIDYQALLIPVIDDRLDTPSMRRCGADHPGFNGPMSEGMWLHYLGEDADRSTTSPYAAPGRAKDLAGAPPAFVLTNGLDPLCDEGIRYAARLMEAGVRVELHSVPGAYHGAPPLDPKAATRGYGTFFEAIGQALHPES